MPFITIQIKRPFSFMPVFWVLREKDMMRGYNKVVIFIYSLSPTLSRRESESVRL